MGMLFQNGALLTDEDVFENVAFPLREHTDLPECADPQHRAHQAAGRGPARRGAADARGAVRRHGAARGARARDGDRSRGADLRRAVHRSRSDLDGHDRAAGAADELRARHHQHRRVARRRGAVDPRGRELHHRRRQGGGVRQLRRAEGPRFGDRAPVHQRPRRRTGAFHYPAPDYYEQLLAD